MAEELLNIERPFDPPLTNKQRDQLIRPTNFSFLEKFYIYYDALVDMIEEVKGVTLLRFLGMTDEAKMAMETSLNAIKVGRWLSSMAKMRGIEKGYLLYPENDLDSDRLAWGRAVAGAISQDPLLMQVWAYHLQLLIATARKDSSFCYSVEATVTKAPDKRLPLLLEKCKADAESAGHESRVFHELQDDLIDRYWGHGQLVPDMETEVLAAFKQYEGEHKDELSFLVKRKKAVHEKIIKQFEEEGINPDAAAAESVPDLRSALLRATNCGNPSCPIHGELNKTTEKEPARKALPAPSSSNANTKKEDSQSMALNTLAPSKNKNDKTDKDEIKFQNVSVQFVTDPNLKNIQLPDGMTLKEGRYWLQKIEDEETRIFTFEYKFKGWFPLDAMWSTYKAMSEYFGFVHVADFQSWFGSTPPTMMTIDIEYGNTQQMPWGPIEVNGISVPFVPSIELEQGLPTLVFRANIRNNERQVADKIMKRATEMLKTGSIYRGKPVEVDFTMFSPNDFRFDPTKAPRFWDVSQVSPDNLILPDDVQDELSTSLWGPIRNTASARKHKVPLRRGVLIDGSYGVGKTLAARVTAKICQDNGWTFLYLKHLDQLEQALYFAKKYEPCVIFAEDVNRIVNGERDADMDKLFNVMDGVDRKDDEVMVVFTTNNIEEIHAGMLRPGRIDSVIKVTPPDAVAARKLIKLYSTSEDKTSILAEDTTLEEAGNLLAGHIPAIIREAVERAKLAAIVNTVGEGEVRVTDRHLNTAAKQMLLHAELLKPAPAETPDLVILGRALGDAIAAGGIYRKNMGNISETDKDTFRKEGLKKILDEAGRPSNGQPEA